MVPKAVAVLLDFTPEGASNILDASLYLYFVLKFIIAFGLAFLLPVFLVCFNIVGRAAGAGDAQGLAAGRHGDLPLRRDHDAHAGRVHDALPRASPMIVLYFASVGIAVLLDRRREARRARLARPPGRPGLAI